MNRLLISIVILFLTSACGFKYQPETLREAGIPKGGSPEFDQGWRDGCDSGMAAFGNYTYKLIYSFKKDMTLINNQEYTAAWNSAYNSCRWYTSTWLQPPGGGGLF